MFRYHVRPNSYDSHQVEAGWFAVIVRFKHIQTFDRTNVINPDNQSLNVSYPDLENNAVDERKALLLTNQLVNWQVSSAKSQHTGTASFKCLPGTIDFSREVMAGDWVMLWAFHSAEDYRRTLANAKKCIAGEVAAANGFHDGLKFVGRINAPKREYSVDNNGRPSLHYQFTAVSFGEFDAQIYYNESHRAFEQQLVGSSMSAVHSIASKIETYIQEGHPMSTRQHQLIWLNVFLGSGPDAASKGFGVNSIGTSIAADALNGGLVASPNDASLVPATIGKLLGVSAKPLRYVDILNTFIGIQKPAGKASNMFGAVAPAEADAYTSQQLVGLGFDLESAGELSGTFLPQWTSFDNTSTWRLLEQFSNAPLNEMFVTLRVGGDGRVKPSYICRQNPLSSKEASKVLGKRFPITAFVDLPRWAIDKALVESETVGPSDSLRINYVSVQGMDIEGNTIAARNAFQQVNSPPMADIADIRRSGVRSYITQTNADVSGIVSETGPLGRTFNKFMSDILMDQHLKWTGSLRVKGIQEPIAVGDNVEYDRIIYQLEAVSHMGFVDNAGRKSFSTTLSVSNGISTKSDFAERDYLPHEDEPDHAHSFDVDNSEEDGELDTVAIEEDAIEDADRNARVAASAATDQERKARIAEQQSRGSDPRKMLE